MKRITRKVYYILTSPLSPGWAARLDNTIGCVDWRQRQYARIRVYIKRTIRKLTNK